MQFSYSVIYAQLPGQEPRAAGIILVDEADQMWLRLSEMVFSPDPLVVEYWASLTDDLTESAKQVGGQVLLARLEDSCSHLVQITSVQPIFGNSDPHSMVLDLYRNHVVRAQSSGEALFDIGRYTSAEIMEASANLPSSPAAAMKVLHSLQQQSVELVEVEEIIESDPYLSAQILRFANLGAYYRGGRIRSVRQALIQVGIQPALGFLTGVVLKPMFSSPHLQQVWNRSLALAELTAQLGSLVVAPVPEDELRIIGLVLNIGQLALAALRDFGESVRLLRQSGLDILSAELNLCGGLTHAEIGADLLARWLFPEDIVEAVRYHHRPSLGPALSSHLYLAECLSARDDVIADLDEFNFACDLLGLQKDQLSNLPQKELSLSSRALAFQGKNRAPS